MAAVGWMHRRALGWQALACMLLAVPAVWGRSCDTNAVTNAFQRVTQYSLTCQRALEEGVDLSVCAACEPYYGAYCGFCTAFGDSDGTLTPSSWFTHSHADLEDDLAVCSDYVDAVTNCRRDLASMRANWTGTFGCKATFPCSTAKVLPKAIESPNSKMEVSVSVSQTEDEPYTDFAGNEVSIDAGNEVTLDDLTLLVADTSDLGVLPKLLQSRLSNVTYPNTTLPIGQCLFEFGYRYLGNVIDSIDFSGVAFIYSNPHILCCYACGANQECTYWTYYNVSATCVLTDRDWNKMYEVPGNPSIVGVSWTPDENKTFPPFQNTSKVGCIDEDPANTTRPECAKGESNADRKAREAAQLLALIITGSVLVTYLIVLLKRRYREKVKEWMLRKIYPRCLAHLLIYVTDCLEPPVLILEYAIYYPIFWFYKLFNTAFLTQLDFMTPYGCPPPAHKSLRAVLERKHVSKVLFQGHLANSRTMAKIEPRFAPCFSTLDVNSPDLIEIQIPLDVTDTADRQKNKATRPIIVHRKTCYKVAWVTPPAVTAINQSHAITDVDPQLEGKVQLSCGAIFKNPMQSSSVQFGLSDTTHRVNWIGFECSSEDAMTFVSVDPTAGGEVVLNDGSRFENVPVDADAPFVLVDSSTVPPRIIFEKVHFKVKWKGPPSQASRRNKMRLKAVDSRVDDGIWPPLGGLCYLEDGTCFHNPGRNFPDVPTARTSCF